MSLTPEASWKCAKGALCFSACPGCPYAGGIIPMPRYDWVENLTVLDQARFENGRRKRWQTYLMGFAEHAALMSKDSTQVGAVLVGPDGEVRLTAYNGPPRGVEDRPERFERPAKYLFAAHSEQNLIAFAARAGIQTSGCSVYVTHQPCSSCAKSLIQAGVVAVFFGPGTTSMSEDEFKASSEMFREAGVHVEAVNASL